LLEKFNAKCKGNEIIIDRCKELLIILGVIFFLSFLIFNSLTVYGQTDQSIKEENLIEALPKQPDLPSGLRWVLSGNIYSHMQALVGSAGVMWHGKTEEDTFEGEWTCRVWADCDWMDWDYAMGYDSRKTADGFQEMITLGWVKHNPQPYSDLPGGVILIESISDYYCSCEIFFWKNPEYQGRIMVEGDPKYINCLAETERLAKLMYSRLPDWEGDAAGVMPVTPDSTADTIPGQGEAGSLAFGPTDSPSPGPPALTEPEVPGSKLFAAVGLTALIAVLGGLGTTVAQGLSIKDSWSEMVTIFKGAVDTVKENAATTFPPAKEVNNPEAPLNEPPLSPPPPPEEVEEFWQQVEKESILIPELEKKIEETIKEKNKFEKELHNLEQYYVAGPDEASTHPHLQEGAAYRIMNDPFRAREGGTFDLIGARLETTEQLERLKQEEVNLKNDLAKRSPQRYIIRELPEIFDQIHELEKQKELLKWEKHITEKRRDAGPFGSGKISKNTANDILKKVEQGLIEADSKLEKLSRTRLELFDKLQRNNRTDWSELRKDEINLKVKSLETTKALLKEIGTEKQYDKILYYDQEWLEAKVDDINRQIEVLKTNL
jgi:hypothetical protein